jgi:hypothetical protein
MRPIILRRSARKQALADAAATAYAQWRSECSSVRTAYRRWAGTPGTEKASAVAAYNDALDREERAASRYARLIGRAGQTAQTALFHQRAEIDITQRSC